MKYEHKIAVIVYDDDRKLVADLDSLGLDGWKLEQVITQLTGSGMVYKGIFIREIVDTKKKK